jgi:hypothetical protein
VKPVQLTPQAVPAVFTSQTPFVHVLQAPAQTLRGSTPLTTRQRPSRPLTLHERHAPAQADSQQTPSTQAPDAHSPAAPHVVPSGFAQTPGLAGLTHVDPEGHADVEQQTLPTQKPDWQSAALAQVVPSPVAGA